MWMMMTRSVLIEALTCAKVLDTWDSPSYLLDRLRFKFITVSSRRNPHLEVFKIYISICQVNVIPKRNTSIRSKLPILVAVKLKQRWLI